MKIWFISSILLIALSPLKAQNQSYTKQLLLMGSRFNITAISDQEDLAKKSINAGIEEIKRIEKLISSWDKKSYTTHINEMAGEQAVKVPEELFLLIERCTKVSVLTDGAFDISTTSLNELWKFDGSITQPPQKSSIDKQRGQLGFKKIVLDKSALTVFLTEANMKIGFGAIGKGYAANQARNVMMNMGIRSGVVNAGGDLITWGKELDQSDWKIAIADPKNADNISAWLNVGEMAVVTSGNYEKFFEWEGKKYSHILDPRTGYPVQGIRSVTILCPNAELADGLATGVFVLGKDKGLELINQLIGIECMIIDEKGDVFVSKNLNLNFYKEGTNHKKNAFLINSKP